MSSKLIRVFIVIAVVGFGLLAAKTLIQNSPTPAVASTTGGYIMVSAAQLANVGYQEVKPATVEASRFLNQAFYFRVKEKASGAAWGGDANLVAVMIRPIADLSWAYNNGKMEAQEMSGKFQARLGGNGYYVVVTGPDKTKVEALAHLLKALY